MKKINFKNNKEVSTSMYEEKRKELKKLKGRANRDSIFQIGEALATNFIGAMCIGTTIAIASDKECSTKMKAGAIGTSAVATALMTRSNLRAVNAISDIRKHNRIYKATLEIMDIIEKIEANHKQPTQNNDSVSSDTIADVKADALYENAMAACDRAEEDPKSVDNIKKRVEETQEEINNAETISEKCEIAKKFLIDECAIHGDISEDVISDDDTVVETQEVELKNTSPIIKKFREKK